MFLFLILTLKQLPLDISNIWLNIIIGLATLVIAVLAFGAEIGNYRELAFFKSLSFRIITLIILSSVIIWASVIKDSNAEINNTNSLNDRDSINQKRFNDRDSINLKRFNESLKVTSSASASSAAETMAKYYLMYDSTQHRVEKIVSDSSKHITNSYSDAKPEFDISEIKFIKSRNDTLQFKLTLNCKKTAIENLNLKLQLYLLKEGNYIYCPQVIGFMPPNIYMSSNTEKIADNINITSLKNIFEAYFHIFGSYQFNNKTIPVSFIMFYNFKESTYGVPGMKDYLSVLFNQQL